VRTVAPNRRTSTRVFDAENRGRVPIGIPACSADDHPVKSELEWKYGKGE
jgi:hypothetical protein